MILGKIPKELTRLKSLGVEVNETNLEIVVGLHVIFNSYPKIKMWLTTKNMHLGNTAPLRLMQIGRAHKVLEFINASLEENF